MSEEVGNGIIGQRGGDITTIGKGEYRLGDSVRGEKILR